MFFGPRCKCGSKSFVRLPRGPLKCTECGAFKWAPTRRKPHVRVHPMFIFTLGAAAAIGGGLAWTPDTPNAFDSDCVIKGNINRYGGERIYHMPGDTYYGLTIVNLAAGERWFCSEAEARAAGWRRARK
jgi:hypothetical protein